MNTKPCKPNASAAPRLPGVVNRTQPEQSQGANAAMSERRPSFGFTLSKRNSINFGFTFVKPVQTDSARHYVVPPEAMLSFEHMSCLLSNMPRILLLRSGVEYAIHTQHVAGLETCRATHYQCGLQKTLNNRNSVQMSLQPLRQGNES